MLEGATNKPPLINQKPIKSVEGIISPEIVSSRTKMNDVGQRKVRV